MRTSCSLGSVRRWSWLALLFAVTSLSAQVAWVTHAPEIDGRVEGSIQQMAAEDVALEGPARITGDLLVPGSPTVRVNRQAQLGSTVAGTGAVDPSRYSVVLNPGAQLGRLRPRTDPVPLSVVTPPPRPTGRREVTLSRARQSAGDFATLRDLEVKEGVGDIVVPPGTYGEFKVHGRNALVLGLAGSATPVKYAFQKLELKSNADLRVVGPVIVTLDDGWEIDAATVGVAAHPEWLEIRFASEGLELKEGARVYAEILAPRGKVEIGNHAELTGGIEAARLTVRRHGGLQLQARPVVNPPVDPALLPYAANFEVAQSYGVGSLAGQQGWEVTRGTAAIVAAVPAADGVWSVEIGAGAEVRRQLQAPTPQPEILFADLYVQPVAGGTAEAGSLVSLGGVKVGLLQAGTAAQVVGLSPEGAGTAWQPVGLSLPVDDMGRVGRWVRLTARLDFPQGLWDLWVDGNLVGADLALTLIAGTPPAPGALVVTGPAANSARLDSIYVGGENPLYADVDHDGMNDAWETTNGLDLAVDDRDGDRDGDGLTNLREYRLGLRADRRDSDGDGMPDDWELAHGLDPKGANTLEADADRDGVPDADEFLIGTDPTKADTDGDGLPDFWEAVHKLDPLSPTGAEEDPDGDGLTNRQEYAAGSDPRDFYNGVEPVTAGIGGGATSTDDTLTMKVMRPDGSPWMNAPVEFQVTDGGRRISATPGGPSFGFFAEVRADSNGLARVYLEPLVP
jgi:hypothetical protein